MKRLLAIVLAMLIVPLVAVTAFAYEIGDVIPESNYLTFESLEKDVDISLAFRSGNVQYKLNGGSWNSYNNSRHVNLKKGDKVSFKGSGVYTNNVNHFTTDGGLIAASGTLKSLALNDEGKYQGITTNQFESFFKDTTSIIGVDNLLAEVEKGDIIPTGNKKIVVGSMATNTGATVAVAGIIAAAGIAASVYCLKKK